MTLPVGLAALQGFFESDFRAIAAGVTMTVVPILLFFIVVQRYFVRGPRGRGQGVTAGRRAEPSGRSSDVLGRVMLAFDGDRLPRMAWPTACRDAPVAGITLFRHRNVGSPGQVPRADRGVPGGRPSRTRPGRC